MDFAIGDPHFFDNGIIKMEGRPFKNVDEMNETLIKNYNKKVRDTDKVYFFGDFAYEGTSKEQIESILSQLKGIKILVMGNHDRNYTPTEWREMGFDEVYDCPILYNGYYILSHEPLYVTESSPYANIYAHVHGNPNYKDVSSRGACVSAERLGYTPCPMNDIIKKY